MRLDEIVRCNQFDRDAEGFKIERISGVKGLPFLTQVATLNGEAAILFYAMPHPANPPGSENETKFRRVLVQDDGTAFLENVRGDVVPIHYAAGYKGPVARIMQARCTPAPETAVTT